MTPPTPKAQVGEERLVELIKLGTTRFSRDRGEPDPTPAFPYEVAFAMGNWEQFVLGIKKLIADALAEREERVRRETLEEAAKICDTFERVHQEKFDAAIGDDEIGTCIEDEEHGLFSGARQCAADIRTAQRKSMDAVSGGEVTKLP